MATPITFRARVGVRAAFGLCTLLATACGGGGDTTAPPPPPPPPPPSLTGISVAPAAVTLNGLTSTATLTATLQPAGIAAAVSWTSEQPAIATVVASGSAATVTAVAGGTARIVARAGTFEAATTVTVVPLLRTLTVPPDTIRLAPGGTQPLVPTLGKDAGADTSLTYTSSASAVATVSAAGVILAVAPGTALITVQSVAVPALTAVVPVRVALPTVGVQITPVNPTVLTGATQQLSAVVTAPVGVATSVTWSSSASAVATVNSAGLVTAVAPGTAMIAATSTANPAHRDSTRVLVRAPTVRGITLTPQTAVLFPGSTRPLVATLDADTGANSALEWTSSDAAIASVSAAGVVTGVALGGPVSITARSVLVPSVSASVQVRVTAPPAATQFTFGRLGSGLSLGGIGAWDMATVDATHAIVGLGFQGGGGGSFVNQLLLRSANGWRNISPACCGAQGFALVSAASATDMLVAYTGGDIFVPAGPKRVFRWNGTSLVDTDYPASLATNVFAQIEAVRSTGNGEHLLLHRSGLLYRYSAGVWTRVDSLESGSAFNSFGAFVAWHRDSLIAFSCPGGADNRLVEFANGTQRVLPAPPGSCRGLSGQSRTALANASASGLALWNGASWTLITNGLQSSDVLWTSATCGAERYAAARGGNVYQLQGATLVRIASDGEALAQSEFSNIPVLDCAPDGTLRLASGDALIVRRSGNGWIEENYAPLHTRVHLSAEGSGFAVGNGVVHRLHGGQWQRTRRVATGERLTDVASFADGRMIATGQLRRSIAMALRYTGTRFELDTLPEYASLEAVAPLAPGQALAVARSSLFTVSSLLRYDNGWQSVPGGVANPVAVSTSAPDNGFVVGSGGAVARFNGSTFEARPSLPANNLSSLALHAVSPTEVFAASCSAVWRLAGSAWVNITPSVAGGSRCFRALFGTGATDMYVVVELNSGGAFERLHRLLRWDGTSWSTLPSVPDSPDLRTGHAVPGRTVLTGAAGYIGAGVPPGAARAGVRR